jgi:hypothetical protein
MPVIHSAEEQRITLRSSYNDLSVSQVQSMPNISIREKNDWGFYGHSTINHSYGLKVINGDKVVQTVGAGQKGYSSFFCVGDTYEYYRKGQVLFIGSKGLDLVYLLP